MASSASDRITCPHCQASIKAPPLAPGSVCNCPKCNLPFPIGQKGEQPAKAPSAAARPEAARPTSPKPAAVPAKPKPKQPATTAARPATVPAPQATAAKAEPVKVEPAHVPLPPRPVISVADDDVIGKMLLGVTDAAQWQPAPEPAPAAKPVATAAAARPVATAAAKPVAPAPQPARPPASAPQPVKAAPAKPAAPAVVEDAPVRAELAAPSAVAAVQPAHQQQPPEPPPAPKPVPAARTRAPEIPVVCWLCGTRMYARQEQRGTKIRCPDCHSDNEVALESIPAVKRPSPVVLSDEDHFALSEPVQRPGYKPTVEPTGEYLGLADLDTKAPPRPPARPAPAVPVTEWPSLAVAPAAPASNQQPAAPVYIEDEEDDGEIAISQPVERIDYKRVVRLPPPDEIDEDDMHQGRFHDEEWGFAADPKDKEAWKKSPFLYGIAGFLFYGQTLYRFLLYSFLLSLDLLVILGAVYCSTGITPLLLGALGLSLAAGGLSVAVLGGSLPCLAAIAQDTANGYDAVENWPDWNIVEWLMQALSVAFAAFLAGMPGGIVASACLSMGEEGLLLAPIPVLISELMFYPIVFGSMLAEGSLAPVSATIFRSFQKRGDGWLMFYLWTILLGIAFTAAICLFGLGIRLRPAPVGLLVAPFAAVLWVGAMILYFRLLGRLLWFVQNWRPRRDRPL